MCVGIGQADGKGSPKKGNRVYSSIYQFPPSWFIIHTLIHLLNKYLLRACTDTVSALVELLLSNKIQTHAILQGMLRTLRTAVYCG